jgi:hypothetical protein
MSSQVIVLPPAYISGSDGLQISNTLLSACNGDEGVSLLMLQTEMWKTMGYCGFTETDKRLMLDILKSLESKDGDIVAVFGVYAYLLFLQNKIAVFFAKKFFANGNTTVQEVKDLNKGPYPLSKKLVCLLLTDLEDKAKEIYIRGPPESSATDEDRRIYNNAKHKVNDMFDNILVTAHELAVYLRNTYGTVQGDADKFLTKYRIDRKENAKQERLHKKALTVGSCSSAFQSVDSASKPEGTEDSPAKRFKKDHHPEDPPMPPINLREPLNVPSPPPTPEISSAPRSYNFKKTVASSGNKKSGGKQEKTLKKIVAIPPEKTANVSSTSSSPVKFPSITPPTTKVKSPPKPGRIKEVNSFTFSSEESALEFHSPKDNFAVDDDKGEVVCSVPSVTAAPAASLKKTASQSVHSASKPEGTEDSPAKRFKKDHHSEDPPMPPINLREPLNIPSPPPTPEISSAPRFYNSKKTVASSGNKKPQEKQTTVAIPPEKNANVISTSSSPAKTPLITSSAEETLPVSIRSPLSATAPLKKSVFKDAAKVCFLSEDDEEVQFTKITQHVAFSKYNLDVKQLGNEIYFVDKSHKKAFRATDCMLKIEFPQECIEID